MTTKAGSERLWRRRLRWRLRGAWVWPAFGALTLLDGLILHALPPSRAGFPLVAALIVSSFANLFLIGAVAPWLARRLAERRPEGTGPPLEVIVDRTATVLLVLAAVGVLATGLGSRRLNVLETESRSRATDAFVAYLDAHGTPEELANIDNANTERVEEDFFRICIALNDRTRASCYFVDAGTEPARVTRDGDARPNQLYFR